MDTNGQHGTDRQIDTDKMNISDQAQSDPKIN